MKNCLPVLLLAGVLFGCSDAYKGDIIISNINIVDVDHGKIIPGQTIIINHNVIDTIMTFSPEMEFISEEHIDGTNKYIIPGLWDMHTHLLWSLTEFNLHNKMMISNGVTGFRDMWGSDSVASTVKRKIRSNELIHQRFYRTNHMLDGEPESWEGSGEVSNPEEAKSMVDSLVNSTDTDFIKIYTSLSKESFHSIAERSKELGIDFMGHIPREVPVVEAIEAGLKSSEHLNGFLMALSTETDSIYKSIELGVLPSPIMLLQTQSNERIEEIASKLKEFGSYITPTFTVKQGNLKKLKQYPIDKDERDLFIPESTKAKWILNSPDSVPPPVLNLIENNHRRGFEIVKLLNDQGVSILAGTDVANSNPFTYAGFSLQDELQNFVDAGLTPHESLKTATLNAAKFINKSDSLGLVKSGFFADLVILNGNPLEDIKNTRKIESVITNGALYNRQSLDSLQIMARNLARNSNNN